MKTKTCSFTGHSPQNFPFGFKEDDVRCVALKEKLREEIERQITQNDVCNFISGMELGIDTYAVEIILELKGKYPYITCEAAIPYEEQHAEWKEKDRDRYFSLIEKCDKETFVSRHYTPDCMDKGSKYMVDNSDIVIAVWNGNLDETGKTVEYAKKSEKTVVIIEP